MFYVRINRRGIQTAGAAEDFRAFATREERAEWLRDNEEQAGTVTATTCTRAEVLEGFPSDAWTAVYVDRSGWVCCGDRLPRDAVKVLRFGSRVRLP